MNIIINTDNNSKSPNITSSELTLYDIVVAKEDPHVFTPNESNADGTLDNAYEASTVLAYVYKLDILLKKTDALRNLAGFDIRVFSNDTLTYEVRTLVSRSELGDVNSEVFTSPSGLVKYYSGETNKTVISTTPLSPKSKLLDSQSNLASLQAKQESVSAAASNTTPGLLKTMNSTTGQNTAALNDFLFKNGGSYSDLANASISTIPLEDSISKSSLGMDWFAPKDNTNVYLSKGRIVNKSSLLEDRIAALRIYDDQVASWVDIVADPDGLSGPQPIDDSTTLWVDNSTPRNPRVYRKIEIPKEAIKDSTFSIELRPLQISSDPTSSMLWDSFSSSWVSSEAPTPFKGATFTTISRVNHASMLANLFKPILPVNITAVQTVSSIRITVSALDPGKNSVTVKRLKLKYTPTGGFEHQPGAPQDLATDLVLSPSGVKTAVIVDNMPLVYPYYACYIANNGDSGIESQVVIEGRKNQYTTSLSIDSVSIVASNGKSRDDGVSIVVANIPSKARQIKIMRENLDSLGASREKTVLLKSDTGQDTFDVNSALFEFKDRTAQLGKKYRYFPVLRTILGVEEICIAEAFLIRSYSLRKIPFTLTLAEPVISAQGADIVNISIVANVNTNELSFASLVKMMSNAKMDKTFQTNVNNQRSQFPSLAVYKVKRVNITTGVKTLIEWASAGELPTSMKPGANAVDSKHPGFTINDSVDIDVFSQRFYYEFELSLRPPEAFLAGAMSSYPSYTDINIATRRAVTNGFLAEWGYLGALPSTEDIKAIASGEMPVERQLNKGLTGHVITSNKILVAHMPSQPVINVSYVNELDNIVIRFSESAASPSNIPIYKAFLMYKGPPLQEAKILQTLKSSGEGEVIAIMYSNLVGIKEYYVMYMYFVQETGEYAVTNSNSTIFKKATSESKNIKVK